MIELQIENVLKEQGRTYYWLAKESGINHATIWKLRHGHMQGISFDNLERICRTLQCQPGDILSFKDGKKRLNKKR